jgi:hypothetical protein
MKNVISISYIAEVQLSIVSRKRSFRVMRSAKIWQG